jgi:cell pole-organizing protein PopZ
MGDLSAEPSMEDILSSIKRIIAEEGDGGSVARARRAPRPAPRVEDEDDDEILELNEAVAPQPQQQSRRVEPAPRADVRPEPKGRPESIVSAETAEATRGPLEVLSRLIVKPETPGGDTLEGLVREMLRPMLREWLDAKLPGMVEQMVAREIAKITAQSE